MIVPVPVGRVLTVLVPASRTGTVSARRSSTGKATPRQGGYGRRKRPRTNETAQAVRRLLA
jgi:hypothetical protein